MVVRALGCCVIVGLAVLARAMDAAVVPNPAVTVRVYNASGLKPHAKASALDTAASTLASASVDVVWRICPESDACQRRMGPRELAIRLVRAPVPAGFKGALPLGDAMVDPRGGTGALGTLYVDRVDWLAAATDQDAATLLGRVIAHELGHLLLARTSHSPHGLMRAVWSREELRATRAPDWKFTAAEVAAIQARLNGASGR